MNKDYSTYSLDELYDVEEHIDKDAYPDRYQLLLEQIKLKESVSPKPNLAAKTPEIVKKPKTISSRIISIFFVSVFLIYSLVNGQIGAKGKVLSITESPEVFWGIITMLISFIFYDLFKIYKIKSGVKDTSRN